jgi:hypothetical protein
MEPILSVARAQSWVRIIPVDLIYVINVLLLCYAEQVVTTGGLRPLKSVFPNIQLKFDECLFVHCR